MTQLAFTSTLSFLNILWGTLLFLLCKREKYKEYIRTYCMCCLTSSGVNWFEVMNTYTGLGKVNFPFKNFVYLDIKTFSSVDNFVSSDSIYLQYNDDNKLWVWRWKFSIQGIHWTCFVKPIACVSRSFSQDYFDIT